MKKLVGLIFILPLAFFIGISNAKAFSGRYAYDINSFTITNTNIEIRGWAVLNDASGNGMHNINPTYTLTLVAKNSKGTVLYTSESVPNTNTNPSYSEGTSQPRDYTKAYFTRQYVNGNLLIYPMTNVPERGTYVRNTTNNYFYINTDFTFNISTWVINAIFENLADRKINTSDVKLYFNLTIASHAGTHRVFGTNGFVTREYSETISGIGVQAINVVNNMNSNAQYKLKVHSNLKQITNIAKNGYVQANAGKFLTGAIEYGVCTLRYGTQRIETESNCTKDKGSFVYLYYYNESSANTNDNYTVGTPRILTELPGLTYHYYPVKVGIGAVELDAHNNPVRYRATDGGKTTGYIPAFWTKPIEGSSIYITDTITKNGCETEPGCNPLTESCTTKCCTKLCKDTTANKNSTFCTKICDTPVEIKEDPCKDITDPQKQYCCKYPSDSVCKISTCEAGSDCFPGTNETPTPTDGTCTTTGNTIINFKYPSTGWGYQVVKNNACAISCQESLKSTFQPEQAVKAGMGFTYPVTVDSSRYCTAQYDNAGWKTKVDNAATAANTSYNNMVSAINAAKTLDNACGTKTILTASVPSCPSPYTDSRSGLTCNCTSCETCYKTCYDTCYDTCYKSTCYNTCYSPSKTYPCTKGGKPSTCSGTPYDCNPYPCDSYNCNPHDCNAHNCNPYPCAGSRSLTCPSVEGMTTSYNSSADRCEVSVCSKNHSQLWSTAQAAISAKLSEASSYRTQYNSYAATVNQLNGDRNTCDNYVSNNKYSGASSTKISVGVPEQDSYSITSASSSEDSAYEKQRSYVSTNYQIYQCNNSSYGSQSLVGDYSSTASSFIGTYCNYQTTTKTYNDFWNKKSDGHLGFEFSTYYYVQRYTGDLSTTKDSGYDDGGFKSYIDFNEMSGTNSFDLNMTSIGPNFGGISKDWAIDPFTCQYNVDNLIFPPKGDPNNDKYGSVAFMYRQVSLTDLFPKGVIGWNWSLYPNLISSIQANGYSVYSNVPMYTITLDPQTMQEIRTISFPGYSGTGYSAFYLADPYKSLLVDKYIRANKIRTGK